MHTLASSAISSVIYTFYQRNKRAQVNSSVIPRQTSSAIGGYIISTRSGAHASASTGCNIATNRRDSSITAVRVHNIHNERGLACCSTSKGGGMTPEGNGVSSNVLDAGIP